MGISVQKVFLSLILLSISLSASARDTYVFNMQGVDIKAMIATVADVTNKNFIIDPNIKGKVTVISKKSMSAEEVYQIFLSLLDVHGYSVVPTIEANTFKIIKGITAKSKAVPNDLNGLVKGDQLVTRVIKIQHTQAMQMVQILRPLVPQHAYLAGYADSNMIVISDSANNINRLVELVDRLDTPGDGNIEMVHLKNASAKDLAQTLSALNRTKKTLSQVVVADIRSNSLLIGGDATTRMNLKALILKLDSEVNTMRNTHVLYLSYAKAADIATILKEIVKMSVGAKGANGLSDIVIAADDNSNSLVVKSSYTKFVEIKDVVKKLDIPRAQVHIEAILAEVSYKLEKELGVEWNTSVSGSGVVGEANTGLALKDIFSLTYLNGAGDIKAVLKILQSDTDSNILSTPSLLTLDNQEASIIVGENVPFLTGSQSTQGGIATPFQTIERKDVGLTLKVTPRLNKGSTIIMDIYQEVSNVLPKVQNIAAVDLVTKKRAIETTVMVEDRGMVVLGGLIQDDLVNTVNKVPLLGDIPLIGELFKSSKVETQKANLMVFIRPTILSNPVLANEMAMSKYQFVRSKQIELQDKGVRLIEPEIIPVLPEYVKPDGSSVVLPNPFYQ
ncbi:type II secretion system secretin GspD [sulfur-oxidizing endosymbiont of Gigantopelta aegis]|uniref:type II secretion system secretin GspD n=1 Tax=sulfur-oxidizing endosymbiont of Gigantopelta aegis TaxID=2794934 RepID=UPI0018DE6EAE|nr:type II secretion system secretin GspD [sulfur-oxidizing endosymbiont of Gigantopelta aegis]